ncbi:signal peptidase complex subunit 2-like [Hydractinia symbiolongicarpus]|uniref:signal peptidase complex subunit 2-like n=1 Tax=Hydractinia symbiolongicarpus TaxID=13093 RepID=UPI00254D921A|nr:signal peptidase complex subunit 2-like [Hydractinia symbiolongicarpus]
MADKKDKNDKEIKVDKWDGNALKHAIDDAVRKIFTEDLKYSESNVYVDTRLLFSGLGCGVALYALLYDYLNPFPLSKTVLIMCVLSYFSLMSILTLFMTFIEKNIILIAKQREASGLDPDSKWTIQTTLKRFDNNYTCEITKQDGATKKNIHASFSKCVSTWVNDKGVILVEKLKNDVLDLHRSISGGKKNQ